MYSLCLSTVSIKHQICNYRLSKQVHYPLHHRIITTIVASMHTCIHLNGDSRIVLRLNCHQWHNNHCLKKILPSLRGIKVAEYSNLPTIRLLTTSLTKHMQTTKQNMNSYASINKAYSKDLFVSLISHPAKKQFYGNEPEPRDKLLDQYHPTRVYLNSLTNLIMKQTADVT